MKYITMMAMEDRLTEKQPKASCQPPCSFFVVNRVLLLGGNNNLLNVPVHFLLMLNLAVSSSLWLLLPTPPSTPFSGPPRRTTLETNIHTRVAHGISILSHTASSPSTHRPTLTVNQQVL